MLYTTSHHNKPPLHDGQWPFIGITSGFLNKKDFARHSIWKLFLHEGSGQIKLFGPKIYLSQQKHKPRDEFIGRGNSSGIGNIFSEHIPGIS